MSITSSGSIAPAVLAIFFNALLAMVAISYSPGDTFGLVITLTIRHAAANSGT